MFLYFLEKWCTGANASNALIMCQRDRFRFECRFKWFQMAKATATIHTYTKNGCWKLCCFCIWQLVALRAFFGVRSGFWQLDDGKCNFRFVWLCFNGIVISFDKNRWQILILFCFSSVFLLKFCFIFEMWVCCVVVWCMHKHDSFDDGTHRWTDSY